MILKATHGNTNYTSIITVSETSTDVSTNKSTISYKIEMQSKNGYNFALIGSTIVLKINGTAVYNEYAQRSCGTNTTVTFASGTTTVEHNSDGTKSISIEYSYTQSSTASYTPKAASTSGSMTLTNIPRATTAPTFTGIVEKATTIKINPATSSFTHSLKLTFGSNVKWLNSSGGLSTTEQKLSGSSFTFNVPSEYYKQFTGSSATGTLLLTTYSGTTSVGTDTETFTINADATLCLPYLTGTLKDTNSTTANLTSGSTTSNKIVKGYSTATATLSNVRASSSNDSKSTITSLIINGVTQSTSTRSYSKTGYTSSTMTVYVKNSRGCEKTFTLTATGGLVDYIPLTINADFKRTTQIGSEVKLTYKGNYFNQSFGSVSNALTLSWAYKKKTDSSYTTGGTLTPTISGNTYSGNISCGSSFPYKEAYDFIIYYADKLVNTNYKDEITKGVPLFAVFQDGYIQINGIDIKPVEVS